MKKTTTTNDVFPIEHSSGEEDQTRHSPIDFSFVLASSVHDMKNSLGMLLTTLSSMVEKYPPIDADQTAFYSTLEYEAARINGELVQLLSLYRMDEKTLSVEVDQHHVIDLIDEQIARNHTLFQSRDINIQIDCDQDLTGYFDQELLGGVLNNVLVNCARYCTQKLLVGAHIENNHLCIFVADDGLGYPESMLIDRQSQAGVSFSTGSTRLGLLFADKVMELHRSKAEQGYLTIDNNGPLGGGILRLWLP
jgi:signal transduction histidine kinase